jgi:lactonase
MHTALDSKCARARARYPHSHPGRTLLAAAAFSACLAAGAYAQQGGALALVYDSQTRGPIPIPPSERGLQTVVAEPWFKVSDEGLVLEGPAFERDGHLLFCDVFGGRCAPPDAG